MDFEKVNSFQGCGKCIFCLSKCPKCGTAKVKIQFLKNQDGAFALIACECGRSIIKEIKLPPELGHAENEFGEKSDNISTYEQTWYYVPELSEYIEEYISKDFKPTFLYEMVNNTEDEITFELLDDDSESDLPTSITSTIANEPDKHGVIATKLISIKPVE